MISSTLKYILQYLIPFLTLELIVALSLNPQPGCIEPYQFDSATTYVNSNPASDGIFGGAYNNSSGGQNAAWHETGIRTDGTALVLEIRGSWTAWDEATNQGELNSLPRCTICAKKDAVGNCICKNGEVPMPEKDSTGRPIEVDCNDSDKQDIPSSCTCTLQHSTIDQFGTYFIATDYQNKDESLKLPDQQEVCRYTEGLGLYVGLFGKDGNTMPLRVYQIYPTQEICDISRNAQGKCVDDSGYDQTKYVYTSPNQKIFIKDDKSGNNGSDTNPSDDLYHQPGELIKFVINDRYYYDNFGGYNVNFMSGFLRQEDSGLLENIVSIIEDSVLGKISDDGKSRSGGVLEFLYNSIVKDSVFIIVVQMCLIMYIVIFGIYVLSGSLSLSKKELTKRIIKIVLVIFFTTETSWYFYNQIVVGFFKTGMDGIITIFMNISDQAIDKTSLVITSQLERAKSLSYATRFSYVDLIIKKWVSSAVSQKIWSLYFGEGFGWMYIPMIYFIIIAFITTMVMAAFAYVSALLKLVFSLALGPIFMVTVLFNKTDEIFKRWMTIMASQSIQIICLFLFVYLFTNLIDTSFNDLLSFEACTAGSDFIRTIIRADINIIKSSTDRSFAVWLMMIAKLGFLIFLLYEIMKKIPPFVDELVQISIGGSKSTGASGTGASIFGIANSVIGTLASNIKLGLNEAIEGAKSAGRFTGINNAILAAREAIPVRGPLALYRDYEIDKVIKAQQKKFGSGKDADAKIRQGVFDELRKANKGKDGKDKLDYFGMNEQKAILRRLDKKLVQEPAKKFIKEEIKKIKKDKNVPLSKEGMIEELKPRLEKWAKDNSSLDPSSVLNLLDRKSFKKLAGKDHSSLTSSEAARVFADNKEGQNLYLQKLQEAQNIKDLENQKNKGFKRFRQKVAAKVGGKLGYGIDATRERFLAKLEYEERENKRVSLGMMDDAFSLAIKKINQSVINRVFNRGKSKGFAKAARAAKKNAMADVVLNAKANMEKKYTDKLNQIKRDHEQKLKEINEESKKRLAAAQDKEARIAISAELTKKQEEAKKNYNALREAEMKKIREELETIDKKIKDFEKPLLELMAKEEQKTQDPNYEQIKLENEGIKLAMEANKVGIIKIDGVDIILDGKNAAVNDLDTSASAAEKVKIMQEAIEKFEDLQQKLSEWQINKQGLQPEDAAFAVDALTAAQYNASSAPAAPDVDNAPAANPNVADSSPSYLNQDSKADSVVKAALEDTKNKLMLMLVSQRNSLQRTISMLQKEINDLPENSTERSQKEREIADYESEIANINDRIKEISDKEQISNI